MGLMNSCTYIIITAKLTLTTAIGYNNNLKLKISPGVRNLSLLGSLATPIYRGDIAKIQSEPKK